MGSSAGSDKWGPRDGEVDVGMGSRMQGRGVVLGMGSRMRGWGVGTQRWGAELGVASGYPGTGSGMRGRGAGTQGRGAVAGRGRGRRGAMRALPQRLCANTLICFLSCLAFQGNWLHLKPL